MPFPAELLLLGAPVVVDCEQQRAVFGSGGAEVQRRLPAPAPDLHQWSARDVAGGAQGRLVQGQALVDGHEAGCRLGQLPHDGVQETTNSESSAEMRNSSESSRKYLATHNRPKALKLARLTTTVLSFQRAAR